MPAIEKTRIQSMLKPHHLGEKGESRFREICADVGLVCNKADRDLTGWDFIVEFEFDANEDIALDHRCAPISCFVQVKTVSSHREAVRLRLSGAEMLAKELKPCFIYVLVVDQRLNFSAAYLLHVFDGHLSKILKRLRGETKLGARSRINKKQISFTLARSEELEPSGAGLMEGIAKVCGDGMYAYSQAKREQLQNLGFDDESFKGNITFSDMTDDDFLDMFLGLKTDVPVPAIETSETRFGITLPSFSSTETKITVTPQPIGECTLLMREEELSPAAVFDALAFAATVPFKAERARILLKADLFTVSLDFNGGSDSSKESTKSRNSLTVSFDLTKSPPAPILEWRNFARLMKGLASGKGNLSIEISGKPSLTIPIQKIPTTFPEAYCDDLIHYCDELSDLLALAGHSSRARFDFDTLLANRHQVYEVTVMRHHTAFKMTVGVSAFDPTLTGTTIVFRTISFGSLHISYYGIGTFISLNGPPQPSLETVDFQLKSFRVVRDRAGYEEFVTHAQGIEGVTKVIRFDSPALMQPVMPET